MKLLSWNLQHGGGSRLKRIAEAIIAHDADVIALSEFRSKTGSTLSATLTAAGWSYGRTTDPIGSDNGLAVFSRIPIIGERPNPAPKENAVRWLDVDFPQHRFGIAALHILCSVPKLRDGVPGEAKARFWNAVLSAAEARIDEAFLFVGDFNTGAHRADEVGRTFKCSEHFGRLSKLGWTDIWRHHNPGVTEWTWYSKLKGGARGNGFRLDHAFATPSLRSRIKACRYSHQERETGLSDHSVLILDLE